MFLLYVLPGLVKCRHKIFFAMPGGKNGIKWPKMAFNGLKCHKMAKNSTQWPNIWMMDIRRKPFARFSGTLLATQHSLATVSALMAVWDPSGHLMPFFAVGHLAPFRLFGPLLDHSVSSWPYRTQEYEDHRCLTEICLFKLDNPPSALFSLAVKFGCCVNICRAVELELWTLSHKKNEI